MPEFGPVQITTRPQAVMARVLRMTSMSIASSAGLRVGKVEDIALATNEAFAVALSKPNTSRVTCTVEGEEGSVHVQITPHHGETATLPSPQVDALANRVLESITSSFNHDRTTGAIRFTITND